MTEVPFETQLRVKQISGHHFSYSFHQVATTGSSMMNKAAKINMNTTSIRQI